MQQADLIINELSQGKKSPLVGEITMQLNAHPRLRLAQLNDTFATLIRNPLGFCG